MKFKNINSQMGRPKIYDRDNQKTIRFYIESELKEELKILAIQHQKTLQELYDEATSDILENLRGERDYE